MIMKKYFIIFSLFLVQMGAVEFEDYFGKGEIDFIPKRTIYLSTHIEVPAMLDIWDRVVGISSYAFDDDIVQKSAPLARLKRFPTDHYAGLNIEELKALGIDLIVTYPADLKSIAFAKGFGIRFLALRTQSIASLLKDIDTQAKIFNKQALAKPRLEAMKKMLDFVSRRIDGIEKISAMEVFYKPNQLSGKESMDSDILRHGGVENIGEHYILQGRADVNIENIIKENPKIVFLWWLSPLSVDDVLNNPLLSHLDAIKNKQVYKLPAFDIAGPRTPLIALFIAMKAYPDRFRDVDWDEVVKKYYKDVFNLEQKD